MSAGAKETVDAAGAGATNDTPSRAQSKKRTLPPVLDRKSVV